MKSRLIRPSAIAGLVLASTLVVSAPTAFGAAPPPAPAAVATAPTATALTATAATPAQAQVALTMSDISLEGPAIVDVIVTVTNDSRKTMQSVDVDFAGPVGWQVAEVKDEIKSIRAGKSGEATFQLRVPEKRGGFNLRTFTADATYRGGDGAGSATTTRAIPTAAPLDNLAAAYNNVGITSEANTAAGAFDGEKNSFSAEKLAAAGAGPGAKIDALGATLTIPSTQPGEADNVATSGQAIALKGTGSTLVFFGAGSGTNAVGNATVYYTDGTVTTGSVGLPNWSFQAADAHGATLVVSTDGRNRPSGYGDAAYQYRLFANAIDIDASKTVDFVVLPSNPSLHIFDLGIAP